jgi:alkylation response protein AidB-like acyl-CoA dehydrogenase
MVSFEPTEDQTLIVSTVGGYATKVLRPGLRVHEKARGLPDEVLRALHELGVTTLEIPESAGGPGLPLATAMLVEEELAASDAAVPYAMGGPGALGAVLLELGTPEQQERWLAPFCAADGWKKRGAFAWSEARPAANAGFATTAVEVAEGFVLRGCKSFVIDGGIAELTVVVAQLDPTAGWNGLAAFVVPAGNKGLGAGARIATIGLDVATVSDVVLDDCLVPRDHRLGDGLPIGPALVRAFARIALHGAARAVGLSRAAFELTRDYCELRTAFGKPIGHFQAVAFTLADRLMDVDAARWLVWRAAARWDAGKDARREAAAAAAMAFEVAMRAADDAVQLHGGAGFLRDLPVEKMMRDAKTMALAAPPVSVLDAMAADLELGVPEDLAALLPTPEIQPIFT